MLSPNLLEEAQNCFGASGWQPLEILYYPHQMIPADEQRHPFTKLAPEHPEFEKFSRAFSGHTYAVLDQNKRILSWAGIKDHGNINEIAVGTEAAYRNKGMGKAVVMSAVADILSHGRVPVYVPDKLTNVSSYALAYSCGFLKGGEMMLWEVEAPID